jgi:hypothetical protein
MEQDTPKTEDKFNFIIDSQMLEAAQLCEQKFVYQFMLHLKGARPNRKITMGSFIHKLLDGYYRSLKDGANHHDAQQAVLASYGELLSENDIEVIDAEIVKEAFIASTDFWSHEPWTVKSIEETEIKILHEDAHVRIAYVSKIDLKVDGMNFENMPVDHKSEHSRSDPSPLNNQFTGYAWSTGSSRLLVNKVGFQKTLKPPDKYRRYPMFYTDPQKEEWTVDATMGAHRIMELTHGRRPERNRSSCDKWGGCMFKSLCGVSPESREVAMRELFITGEPWNPLKVEDE